MIRADFENNGYSIMVHGLTQWDYGQILEICGLEYAISPEVHYAARRQHKDAIIDVPEVREGVIYSKIPDELLKSGEELCAYVYIADEDSGKTVRTITLPVKRRQKPGDYDAPAEKNLLRRLLEQVKGKADNLTLDESGEYLQLTSEGEPVGDRIRLTVDAGKEIELKNNGIAIQWRYTNSNEWIDLVSIADLKGKDGETPQFEIRDGHLWAVYPT